MKAVAVLPLGDVEEEILEAIDSTIVSRLGLEVTRCAPGPFPVHAFDAARGQYSSILVLRGLLAGLPRGAARVLAVTGADLFIPMLSFVYGQAQLDGPLALISLARLRQEFYGLPANGSLVRMRACKEAVHELGHTLGLTHCLEKSCPMALSTSIRQLDQKSDVLCQGCSAVAKEKIEMVRKKL